MLKFSTGDRRPLYLDRKNGRKNMESATGATSEATGTMSELLDVRQVAELLYCSKRHIYRLTDSGRMPARLRVGALVRWRRAEILAWIAGGCQPIGSAKGMAR
jgi:excisionase family DNA binding protein